MSSHAVVLVLDDDRAVLRLMDVSLRACGYRVLTAHKPGDALQLLNTHHPHVVVLDHQMARMDGEAFYKRARQKGYRGEVLMMSAWEKGAQAASRLGVSFLDKPFDPDRLCAEVNRLLAAPVNALESSQEGESSNRGATN